jgi:Yip1-like protein
MLKEQVPAHSPMPNVAVWGGVWLAALAQPSAAAYRGLARQPGATARRAYTWICASSLVASAISALAQMAHKPSLDTGLLLAVPIPAVVAVLYWAALAVCTQGVARLMRGAGTYQQLVYAFAMFSAPLTLLVGLLALIPWSGLLLVGVYLYWLALYTIAVRAVHQFSRARAIVAALISFVLIGCIFLAAAALIGYSGLLAAI